jgi:hypothetical protein
MTRCVVYRPARQTGCAAKRKPKRRMWRSAQLDDGAGESRALHVRPRI